MPERSIEDINLREFATLLNKTINGGKRSLDTLHANIVFPVAGTPAFKQRHVLEGMRSGKPSDLARMDHYEIIASVCGFDIPWKQGIEVAAPPGTPEVLAEPTETKELGNERLGGQIE